MTRTSIRRWLQRFLLPRLATRRPTLPVRLALEVLEDRRTPALLTVNTTADAVNPTDGTLSLRDAISAVNAGNENGLTAGEKGQVSGTFGVNDAIEFSSTLSGDTITLNGTMLPVISASVTITGLGASNLAIKGKGSQDLAVASRAQVNLSGLTIEGGSAVNTGTGGISNQGLLTVSNCTITGNGASITSSSMGALVGNFGGIANTGTLTVNATTISNNGGALTGGIYNKGTLTISDSTLSDNVGGSEDNVGQGGALYNDGTLTVSNSTLTNNTSNSGGGIYNAFGPVTVINSTLANNDGFNGGGGILNAYTLTVSNSTLSDNSALHGGGIACEDKGSATLNNTIVANSPKGGDLYLDTFGSTFSGSNDLIGDGSDLGDFSNALAGDPMLGPLGNYGGPTQTFELLPGSPAINAGSNALAVDANGQSLTTDQRGQPRIVGAAVDIGAFESPLNFDKLAAYRPSDGSWSLDSDGSLGFNPATDQVFFSFSPPNVTPVAGDWTGNGRDQIGDFSNGTWHLDLNGNGVLDPGETFQFGQAGDQPVVGDWDGNPSGRDEIGVFRTAPDGITGEFILDIANHHAMDSSNLVFTFGYATDHIIVGDWNGNGTTKVGVYRDAASYIPADAGDIVFSINSNGDHATFTNFVFGLITDKVVVGDWNGSGTSKVGTYRDGSSFSAPGTALFSLDTNGSLMYQPGVSEVFLYGLDSDQFVTGHWKKTPPLQPEGTPRL